MRFKSLLRAGAQIVAWLVVPATALSASSNREAPNTELVLNEGTTLEVTSPRGNIAVDAGKGFARRYRWDGCALNADMGARWSRWYGNLGIYDSAARGPVDFLTYRSCKGVSRTIVEEGQMHFATEEFAEEWIRHRPRSWTTVWTNDGLVISWVISPSPVALLMPGGISVDLVLVCIKGRRPTRLAGATDQAIKLISATGKGQPIHQCADVGRDIIDETQRVLEADWKKWDRPLDGPNRK